MRCASARCRARVDAVQPGADHRDRAARAVERALVRRAVDAQRQARDDGRSRARLRWRGEGARVVRALRRGVAAADDGERRRGQQLEPALRVQQQRRVGGFEQRRRIGGVAERRGHAAPAPLSQPGQRGGDMSLAGVGQARQRSAWRRPRRTSLAPGALPRRRTRPAASRRRPAGVRAASRPTPGVSSSRSQAASSSRSADASAGARRQGWVKRSPARTGSCTCRISA